VPDDEATQILADYEYRNHYLRPVINRILGYLVGWRYDGSTEAQGRLVEQLPMVAFQAISPMTIPERPGPSNGRASLTAGRETVTCTNKALRSPSSRRRRSGSQTVEEHRDGNESLSDGSHSCSVLIPRASLARTSVLERQVAAA
jgi:hypothetical protein